MPLAGSRTEMIDRELLQQALDVVDACMDTSYVEPEDNAAWLLLRARLAQPEQEPVAPMQDLMDIVRSIAAATARKLESKNYPSPLAEGSPLLQAIQQACIERGYTADGLANDAGLAQSMDNDAPSVDLIEDLVIEARKIRDSLATPRYALTPIQIAFIAGKLAQHQGNADPFCYMTENYEVGLFSAPPEPGSEWSDMFPVYRAALSQPEQKPVASIYITPGGEREFDDWRDDLPVGRNLLYTAPQPAAQPVPDYGMDEVDLAKKILLFLGHCITTSREPGACFHTDRIAEMLGEARTVAHPVPLTDEQAIDLINTTKSGVSGLAVAIVRAVEAAHGIGSKP